MSDNNVPQVKYDVFVSFRGDDIRPGFLSHLIEAFDMKKINAFVDDKLEKGDEIWPSLVEAIEGSFISLIIFSPDYASSHWCLEEVVKILECREKYERIVIPVFYSVEPTNVRHQSGSYENAFVEHERKDETKVQSWRQALNKSADLSGIESSKFQNGAQLVKEVVNLVLKRLTKPPFNAKSLVGIDKKIATVESWIRKEPKDTRLIGIWGMGGIGKTTLAEEVFNKLRFEYEGSYFLANERDQSNKHELIPLKEKMFSQLLGYDVKIDTHSLPEDIVRRLDCMKVLIVLDDVNDAEHIEKLLGTVDNFGSGSRIIVTTRDEQVLRANKANEIYSLEEFCSNEALELFNLNAFGKSDHQKEYNELSKRVVDYAQGIPLVVKVLAGLLHGKNKEEWESMLDKLKKMPPTKVYEVMKLSYDGLDCKGRQIFLDLACFFLRTNDPVTVGNRNFLLKDDESDNSVAFELGRLKDKALITFSEDNIVSMHDSLQEKAWEIVRQESIKDPGSRSHLWDPDDIYEALKTDKVTEAIRSIRIRLPIIKEQKLMPHIFAKMSKLRFLEISVYNYYDGYDQVILAAEGLQFLATELIFLCWYCYPLKSLPDNFSTEKLVVLKLRESKMKKLWDGVKNLVNLKLVDLCYSKKLKELPDLSKATNLEVLDLSYCSSLTRVHPSIFSLPKLEQLDLSFCKSLTTLASNWWNSIIEFSSNNIKEWILRWTKVETLPSSSVHQSEPELLNPRGSDTERLPSSINSVTQPLHVNLFNCKKLQTLPVLPLSLETLIASECESLKTVLFPSTAVEQLKENRKVVAFGDCLKLDEQSLVAIGLNAQINMMKFAYQQLKKPNYGSDQAVYVYPGSSVPEWLEYKTTEDYIIIDLSSAAPSPLGLIFCLVLGKYPDVFVFKPIGLNITVGDGEGEGKKESFSMFEEHQGGRWKSDHV